MNEMNDCLIRADAAYREIRFRDALQIGFFLSFLSSHR